MRDALESYFVPRNINETSLYLVASLTSNIVIESDA